MDPILNWYNTTFKRQTVSDKQRKVGEKPGTDEIGVSGESLLGVYADAEARTDKLTVADYVKMRQNDGTIASLYNLMTLPILSTTYTFEADEDDKTEEQADFIRSVLLQPPHKGGMEMPFQLLLADMLRAVMEGFRVFERVYRIREDGKVVYKKLAPRDSNTLYLIRADDGGYGGLHQRTSFKAHYIDVYLPPEKTFLFTYGKDKNYLYGESAFKPAAYHYEIKHKLYYLANLSAQVGAVPPSIISGPANTEEPVKRRLLREFQKLGVRTTAYKPEQFTVEPYDTSKGRLEPTALIDHHNSEIYRSCLAQFLMLGQASRSVGSWSLSQNHTDIFMMALRGVMSTIEEHINFYLIPDLIDINFAEPHYPEFKFENIAPDTKEILHDAFVQLSTNGQLSEAMVKGIEDMVAATLEIDIDEVQKEVDKINAKKAEEADQLPIMPAAPSSKNPIDPASPAAPAKPAQPPVAGTQKKKSLSNTKRGRELTPHEQRVNLDGIENHMNAAEAQFATSAAPIVAKVKDDAIARLKSLLEAGDVRALKDFALKGTDEYRALMVQTMRASYEYGKKGAADELKVASPATNRQSAALIVQHAGMAYDKQMSDLLFGIKAAVLSATRKQQLSVDLGIGDVLQAVSALFGTFSSNRVAQTAAVMVSSGVALGRRDVFEGSHGNISAYQYSAILDERTCETCYSLDGSVADYAEYLTTDWQPPIHINCRCIWVAIQSDQAEIPDFTGMPDNPGGKSEPDL